MTKTEVRNYAIAGRLLMAHLLGQKIETVTIDQIEQSIDLIQTKRYKFTDWTLDPDKPEDLLTNKRALFFRLGLFFGERTAVSDLPARYEVEPYIIIDQLRSREMENSRLKMLCNQYCNWTGVKDFDGDDLYEYMSNYFATILKNTKKTKALNELMQYVNLTQEPEINSSIVELVVGRLCYFAELELYSSRIYPTWMPCIDTTL